jgi:hypothetical protein
MMLHRDNKGYFVACRPGEKVSGHCPSVDVMFNSVAQEAGKNAVGILLTGMGKDGAQGLLNMRKSGAYTIGQDKDSCVVYGMPMVAFNMSCRGSVSCGKYFGTTDKISEQPELERRYICQQYHQQAFTAHLRTVLLLEVSSRDSIRMN